jgi:hypothetical protein
LVKPRVDDLHPGVAKGSGDDLRPAVVSVEAGLGNHNPDLAARLGNLILLGGFHGPELSVRALGPG